MYRNVDNAMNTKRSVGVATCHRYHSVVLDATTIRELRLAGRVFLGGAATTGCTIDVSESSVVTAKGSLSIPVGIDSEPG